MTEPTATMKVQQVVIQRGEALTIFANQGTYEKYSPMQLEIRVLPDGKVELYCEDGDLAIQYFAEWQPMPRKEPSQ